MKLRYAIAGISIVVLLALPAGATAKGGQVERLAAQKCKQERKELGRNGFRKRYGARNAMRVCVKRARPRIRSATRTAAQECEGELAEIGLEQFIEDYGSDDTGDDAMAECVADTLDFILNPDDYEEDPELVDE